MNVKITANAKKQLRKVDQITKVAVGKKIREMGDGQANLQIKKLGGYKDVYRVRVGSYRIVYKMMKGGMRILAIQHRKDVYRGKF